MQLLRLGTQAQASVTATVTICAAGVAIEATMSMNDKATLQKISGPYQAGDVILRFHCISSRFEMLGESLVKSYNLGYYPGGEEAVRTYRQTSAIEWIIRPHQIAPDADLLGLSQETNILKMA